MSKSGNSEATCDEHEKCLMEYNAIWDEILNSFEDAEKLVQEASENEGELADTTSDIELFYEHICNVEDMAIDVYTNTIDAIHKTEYTKQSITKENEDLNCSENINHHNEIIKQKNELMQKDNTLKCLQTTLSTDVLQAMAVLQKKISGTEKKELNDRIVELVHLQKEYMAIDAKCEKEVVELQEVRNIKQLNYAHIQSKQHELLLEKQQLHKILEEKQMKHFQVIEESKKATYKVENESELNDICLKISMLEAENENLAKDLDSLNSNTLNNGCTLDDEIKEAKITLDALEQQFSACQNIYQQEASPNTKNVRQSNRKGRKKNKIEVVPEKCDQPPDDHCFKKPTLKVDTLKNAMVQGDNSSITSSLTQSTNSSIVPKEKDPQTAANDNAWTLKLSWYHDEAE